MVTKIEHVIFVDTIKNFDQLYNSVGKSSDGLLKKALSL